MKHAVLLPGFNGQARQPILLKLAAALEALGYQCSLPGLPKGRPSPGFVREVAFLRAVIVDGAMERPLLVGRSYGGRVAVRYALEHPVSAVVLLGFPVRPPSAERPEDEAALRAITVPTLVLQGSVDDKGPLEVFEPLLVGHRHLELSVLEGAGHSFARHEREALLRAVAFVKRVDARRQRSS